MEKDASWFPAISPNATEKFLPSSSNFVLPIFMAVDGFNITDSLMVPLGTLPITGYPGALSRLLRIGISVEADFLFL